MVRREPDPGTYASAPPSTDSAGFDGTDGIDDADDADGTDGADGAASFRVALKDSACAAVPRVAGLREQRGEYVAFDSSRAAAAALLDPDRPSLRFQAPAPNDPADVDAYLVKLRDPDPAPDERGPASEGWECRMTANQVGALCESLFTTYRYDPPPFVAYVARDLGLSPDEFRVHVDPDDPPPVDRSTGGAGRWQWDVHFAVRRLTPDSPFGDDSTPGDVGLPGDDGSPVRHYLVEVKHGSTSFERDQRAEMERIAREVPNVVVLVVRIRLDGAPRTYDLTIDEVAA